MAKRQKVDHIILNDVEKTEQRKNDLLYIPFFEDEYKNNIRKLLIFNKIILTVDLPIEFIQKIIFFSKNNIIQERIIHVKYLDDLGHHECGTCGFHHPHSQCRSC